MAIYSLNLGFISRSEGRSSVAFSAYISGSQHKDDRTGKSHNYASREDVVVSKILAPDGVPDWATNPATLWNRVESAEDAFAPLHFPAHGPTQKKRQKSLEAREHFINTAQTAQTVMGAIPLELSKEQAETCVEDFLKTRFVARNLIVHYAIHWDAGNPHFHGLVTRRAIINGAFAARKDHELVSKEEHNITRKIWADIANKHLARAGRDERIDCRSHKDRGSLFEAGFHEGFWAQRLAEKGEYSRIVASNEAVRQRNIEILCNHPEVLIHEVSQKRTTFTQKHLEDEIIRRVGGDEKLFAILKARVEGLENPDAYAPNENFACEVKAVAQKITEKLLQAPEIVSPIGDNIHREKAFTSTVYKRQEETITQLADTLHGRTFKSLSAEHITQALQAHAKEQGFALSKEQQAAIHHLCSGSDIRILNGRAGTGKTTLLKVVADAYKAAGYNVLGTSFQGKAVEIMEREIGITCKTLDSLKLSWARHDYQKEVVNSGRIWGKPYLYAVQKLHELEKSRFTNRDVILVDEANMIAGSLWEPFLTEATSKGAKVLIIQDTAQIKSRESGDYGRLFAERFGTALTQEVMRQKVAWQKESSALLNEGRVLDGLRPYQDKGHIQWVEDKYAAQEALVKCYLADLRENPTHTRITLAYRNKDVDTLNQLIRGHLKTQGLLGGSFSVMGGEFSVGDRVRFTQNDHHGRFVKNTHESWYQSLKEHFMPTGLQGVKNGTFGTVLEGSERAVKIQLDDGRRVKFDPREYPHLTHGYALGIHKSEGSTFDRSFVQLDPLLDSSTLLVAMTRHKYDVQAFANREEILDFKALVDKIGRGASREILQDYQINEAQRPYLERVQQYRDLIVEAATLREEMEGSPEATTPLYKNPSYKGYQACLNEKKAVATEILENWKEHLPYVRLAGLRRDVLEVEAGLRPRLLSDLEHRASLQVQGYREVALEARELWRTISKTHPPVLVKSHGRYEEYLKLRIERDSLAATFQENPKLYTPFFKVTKDEAGVLRDFWGEVVEEKSRIFASSLKQQAAAHEKFQRAKAFEERLLSSEKGFYETTKTYAEATREAASLYHLLKNPPKEGALSREVIQGFFHEKCALRDRAAFDMVSTLDAHRPFLKTFKIAEDKLLIHASRGEIRMKAKAYLSTTDIQLRAQQAEDFLKIFTGKEASPVLRTLCQQEGVEFQRLKFDQAFWKQVQVREIARDRAANDVYRPIQNYLKATQEVGKAWKQKAQTKEPALWERAISERRWAATRLRNEAPALCVFKALYPERVLKLEAHAGVVAQEVEKENAQAFTRSLEKPSLRAQDVLEHSRGRIQELAHDLLGPHNVHRSAKHCLRYGSTGKLSVTIKGPQEGLWHDFSSGEGGNIFKLVQREKGLSFKEAVEYCGWFFGVSSFERRVDTQERLPQTRSLSHSQEVDKTARLEAVYALYQKAQLISGTIAETYLRDVRGIRSVLSDDLKFLPRGTSFTYNGEQKTLNHDCFAAFGRDSRGELYVIQITKLRGDGTQVLDKEGEKLTKIQYGVSKGAFVTIQASNGTSVFIAEGIETALSVREAGVEGRIVASLGIHNIKNYEGPEKQIIICADNDGAQARTNAVIQHAQAQLLTPDRSVLVVRPQLDGQDFNDVLQKQGTEAIREYVSTPALRMVELLQDLRSENREMTGRLSKLSAELSEKLEAIKRDPLDAAIKNDLHSLAKILRHDLDLRDGLQTLNRGLQGNGPSDQGTATRSREGDGAMIN